MLQLLCYPVVFIAKGMGVHTLITVLFALLIAAFSCAWFSTVYLFLVFAGMSLYLLFGVCVILLGEIKQFKELLGHIDAKQFDYRKIKFDSIIFESSFTELLRTYKDLTRVSQRYTEQMNEVDYASAQVIDTANQVAINVKKQSDSTHSTAAAITEMSQSLSDVTQKIEDVFQAAEQACGLSKQGRDDLNILHQHIKDVELEADQTQDQMTELDKASDDVLKMSESIRGIAEQTNLLALNASIEAARAGELGRGFAVVADEVRILAQRSNESANDIINRMENIRGQSKEIVTSMEDVVNKSQICLAQSASVDKQFQNIEVETTGVLEKMSVLSSNAEQQNLATLEISQNVELVVQGAVANSEVAIQAEKLASHLKNLTQVS